MDFERILILLDGEEVVSASVVNISLVSEIEERIQVLKRCREANLTPFKFVGGLDEQVQDLKIYAQENGFRLVEVQAPVYRTRNDLGWLESEILAAILKRTVDRAPRDLDGLRKLNRTEKWVLASGLHDLDGQPRGKALFLVPFEDLEEDEMAERLHRRLAEHDEKCFGTLTPGAAAQPLRSRVVHDDRQREISILPHEHGSKVQVGAVLHRLGCRSEVPQPEEAQARQARINRMVTRAVELANKNPVSLSTLWKMCCHGTAVKDAVRVLETGRV